MTTQTSAKIVCDSVSPAGHRFTTFECVFPRIILAEVNTHRDKSRNSASSRAIPVEKMIQRVWLDARDESILQTRHLLELGIHKQITNRLLECFMWHTALVSGTEWSNFFNLRDNKDAHPDFRDLAHAMRELYENTTRVMNLVEGEWHLPLVSEKERAELILEAAREKPPDAYSKLRSISVGRCARVSYLTHDGKRDPQADVDLCDRLLSSGHMSPFEHVARPMTQDELLLFRQPRLVWDASRQEWKTVFKKDPNDPEKGSYETHFLGNVQGWIQYRKLIPHEEDILGARQ